MSVATMQSAIRKVNAAKPGYDQGQRWTFFNGTKLIPNKECDCSSAAGAIIKLAGYPIDLTGTFYTGNLNDKAEKAGFRKLPYNAKDVKPGDVINAPGHHVEVCYGTRKGETGTWWWGARNDERGQSHGGAAGDQGGRERVGYARPYDMSKGGTRKAYILRPPAPKQPAPSGKATELRHGQANLQAERFGGIDDASPRRGKFLAEEMRCSLYTLEEMSQEARNATRDALPGGKDRWKVQEIGYVCVLWDSTKWDYKTHDPVSFGTPYHGAVRQELVRKETGRRLDVIAIHVRPNDALTGSDADKVATKLKDIAKGLGLARDGIPTIFAGDFNTSHARKYLEGKGWRAVNDDVDTMDKAGEQRFDGIYTRGMAIRGWSKVNPGTVSDHLTLVGNLTLPGK